MTCGFQHLAGPPPRLSLKSSAGHSQNTSSTAAGRLGRLRILRTRRSWARRMGEPSGPPSFMLNCMRGCKGQQCWGLGGGDGGMPPVGSTPVRPPNLLLRSCGSPVRQ